MRYRSLVVMENHTSLCHIENVLAYNSPETCPGSCYSHTEGKGSPSMLFYGGA